MTEITTRDITVEHDGEALFGLLVAPAGARSRPGILLVHDAFGLGEDMIAIARRLAGAGYAVFAADVWGERRTPADEAGIGPLIGGMVADRERWIGRIAASRDAAAAQPEIDVDALAGLGYCFGGSSLLEYLRTGGRLRAAAAIHPGLDLVADGWAAARADTEVLVCVGADDPMATAEMRERLHAAMSGAGIDWREELYSGTVHAFTSPKAAHSPNPEVIAYHPRNARRAWDAAIALLSETLPLPHVAAA
ncbi:dienelactone hydrolase family protein [Agromyces archimandritae]|uniref:Dienelactone hydrolase family protein n=1 Tax=Agromyces archimandritae TaxID=2781962 RepID=A0A975FKY8_9MICO|nr:dienelactone hydrolase family protein [Agromyces archimandritae]QTX04428.1 dienelactone hydrolase family protein [Agromyces archimandritae]